MGSKPSRKAPVVEEWGGGDPRLHAMEDAPGALARGWWSSPVPALQETQASCPENPPGWPLGPQRPGPAWGGPGPRWQGGGLG